MTQLSGHCPVHAQLACCACQDISQVDDVIERLLDVRNGRPGRQVQLAENEIRLLCLTAKEIFMSQPNLLELEAPIKICGGFRCINKFSNYDRRPSDALREQKRECNIWVFLQVTSTASILIS